MSDQNIFDNEVFFNAYKQLVVMINGVSTLPKNLVFNISRLFIVFKRIRLTSLKIISIIY